MTERAAGCEQCLDPAHVLVYVPATGQWCCLPCAAAIEREVAKRLSEQKPHDDTA